MKRLIIAAAVALLVVLIALGAWVWIGVSRPYRGYTADEQFVEIPQGAGPISIGRRLAEAC